MPVRRVRYSDLETFKHSTRTAGNRREGVVLPARGQSYLSGITDSIATVVEFECAVVPSPTMRVSISTS